MKSIETFLSEIGEACWGNTDRVSDRRAKLCLSLRFDPRHYDRPNSNVKNTVSIAGMMGERSRENVDAQINQIVSSSAKSIIDTYREEMESDGEKIEHLNTLKPGEKGLWKEVYRWLWNQKFIRWCRERYPNSGEDWFFDCLSENAKTESVWIEVINWQNQRIAGGKRRQDKTISIDTSCSLRITLNYPNYHYLLFNRCASGIIPLCPSPEFAPETAIPSDKPLVIPQPKVKYEDLIFETLGKEEFIAIVVNSPLANQNLSIENLYKFWLESVQGGKDIQVFYDRFEVVNE